METGERAARWRRASAGGVPRNSRAGLGGRRHAGVRIASGSPGVPRSPAAPDWLAELAATARAGRAELPPGFGSGWRYAAPLIHMPTYLRYLQARFERAGGTLGVATVASLAGRHARPERRWS